MHKLKNFNYRIWTEDNIVMAEVEFEDWDNPNLKKFRDLYAEKIKNSRNLEILKDEGYPTELDSEYILLEKDVFDKAKNLIETFRKEFPNVPKHPALLSFLLRNEKYKKYKNHIIEREEKEKQFHEGMDNLFSFSIGTSHDYPYVMCYSKIHSESELEKEIEEIIKSQITRQSS